MITAGVAFCDHHDHEGMFPPELARYSVEYRNGLPVGDTCAEHLADTIDGVDVVVVRDLEVQ